MVPKPKHKAPSSPQKKSGEGAKCKSAQQQPKFPSPPKDPFGHDKMGLSLQDVMTTRNLISARLADHDVCFREMAVARETHQVPEAPHVVDNNRQSDTQPMDVFDSMEDVVRG